MLNPLTVPVRSVEHLTQALASYEELSERRRNERDDALDDLEKTKAALELSREEVDALRQRIEDLRIQLTAERSTRSTMARQVSHIAEQVSDVFATKDSLAKQMKASVVLQSVRQLADATRSLRWVLEPEAVTPCNECDGEESHDEGCSERRAF